MGLFVCYSVCDSFMFVGFGLILLFVVVCVCLGFNDVADLIGVVCYLMLTLVGFSESVFNYVHGYNLGLRLIMMR